MTEKYRTEVLAKVLKEKYGNTIQTKECRQDLLAALDKLTPEIRSHQPKLIEKFLLEHSQDCAKFEFRCERYGDFLAVFIKRGEEAKGWDGYTVSNKMVAAVNTGKSPQIRFHDGNGVDMQGKANPSVTWEREDDDRHYRAWIYPGHPCSRYGNPMLELSVRGIDYGTYDGDDHKKLPAIDACARAARDDLIEFAGGHGTLHAPFGRGREVYDKILAAFK